MRHVGWLHLGLVLILSGCSSSSEDDLSADAVPIDAAFDGTDLDTSSERTDQSVLRINEVVASAVDGGVDWFELVVVGDQPVDLSSYSVVDDNEEHAQAPLGGGFLEPGAFLVVKALASDETSTELHVPFKLGSDDSLTLFRDGEQVDALDWEEGDAREGTSFGRLPDGTGQPKTLHPTPGLPNSELDETALPCTDPFDGSHVAKVEFNFAGDGWEKIQAAPAAEEYQEASFAFDGVTIPNVAIRTKGNSSLNAVSKSGSHRFPFKVDFNRYVEGQAFCGLKKVIFNNGFKDPSLMREHLAYRLARAMGLPASRTMYANVWVNGEHIGLYLMVEPVDDDFFLEEHFANDDGDLYKPDWPAGHLQDLGDQLEDYEGVEIENNQETSDHSKLMQLIQMVNHGPFEALDSVWDVDMMLRYATFNSLLVNLDSYTGNGHNYYIYEQEGVFSIIPWDLNEAFGNFTCGCSVDDIVQFLIDEPTCGPLDDKPLLAASLYDPDHVEMYHQMLASTLVSHFNTATLTTWIEDTANMIRSHVEADPTKFFSIEDFEASLYEGAGGSQGLLSFVEKRSASITSQLEGQSPRSANGAGNCNGGGGGPGGGGPGGGGPGGNPKCPDGICDAAEQANPALCPEDCGG